MPVTRNARWIAAVVIAAGCERASPAQVDEVHDWLDQVHCRLQDGIVECRGLNKRGVVRAPAAEIVVEDWHRIPISERVVRLDLSYTGNFACGATASGRVYCWGGAAEGALGNGELPPSDYRETVNARPVPQQVIGLDDVKDLGLGIVSACALTHAGAVLCWGSGSFGVLGDGNDNAPSATPIVVIDEGARSFVVTPFQTCALMNTDRVRCWGGDLPDSSGVQRPVLRPTEIMGIDDGTALTSERYEICVRRRGGERQCWPTGPERPD